MTISVIILLVVVGILAYTFSQSDEVIVNDDEDNSNSIPINENAKTYVIEITSEGFIPKSLEITAGDSITWINEGVEKSWPASAVHPSHTNYPGSGISKCGTDQSDEIFDACKGLANGESWSFTFNEVGTWNYHDHLNSEHFGTIIVK